VERVQEIQALEETLAAQVPGRIHLELEDADGAGTRLRLALSANRLAGSVDPADPLAAERMRARVGELHEALARRGMDAQALGIQGLRPAEAGSGQGPDLATLLQDPLAGLSRVMEAREGATGDRSDRNAFTKDEAQRETEGSRNGPREDRNKEDRR
jgi:hypothetical protein